MSEPHYLGPQPTESLPAVANPHGTAVVSAHAEVRSREIEIAAQLALSAPPRDWDVIEAELVAMATDPMLADVFVYEVARNNQPIYELGVRFAEEAISRAGHIRTWCDVQEDGPERRMAQLLMWDLKTGTIQSAPILVEKVIERYSADGRDVLRSYVKPGNDGKPREIFVCVCKTDEVREAWERSYSLVYRNVGLRMIPLPVRERVRRQAMEALGLAESRRAKKHGPSARRPGDRGPAGYVPAGQSSQSPPKQAEAAKKPEAPSLAELVKAAKISDVHLKVLTGGKAVKDLDQAAAQYVRRMLEAIIEGRATIEQVLDVCNAQRTISRGREIALKVNGGDTHAAERLLAQCMREAGYDAKTPTRELATRVLDLLEAIERDEATMAKGAQ